KTKVAAVHHCPPGRADGSGNRESPGASLTAAFRQPEGAGCCPKVLSEQRGQMALAGAADLECHVGQGELVVRQQFHRPPEPAAYAVLMRRHSGSLLEATTERERIQADFGRDVFPLELRVKMVVDEPDGASQ